MSSSRHILVVEDEEIFRSNLCAVLVKCGYSVTGVGTMKEAREHLATSDVDVLLLDASLPDGCAEDLLACNLVSQKRVVVITGTCDGDRWIRLAARTDMIVPKPVSLSSIQTIVAELLARTDSPTESFALRFELSPREASILKMAATGMRDKEIAYDLGVSPGTQATYWQRIFKKTGQRSQRDVLGALVRHLTRD